MTDISVVLSGGVNNINSNLSLGGASSLTPVVDEVLNNLFDDISADQTNSGHIDHRCIYFFNDGDGTIYDFKIWIGSQVDGGASVKVGTVGTNEVQRIEINYSGNEGLSGNLKLAYDGFTEWVVDLPPTGWQFFNNIDYTGCLLRSYLLGIKNEDNKYVLFGDDGDSTATPPRPRTISVSAQQWVSDPPPGTDPMVATYGLTFDIIFDGYEAQKSHPLITLVENNLSPNATVTITRSTAGSPVNTIAPSIGEEATTPVNVSFANTTLTSPIIIPKLNVAEGFPLWLQRITEIGTESVENDSVTINYRANFLPGALIRIGCGPSDGM